jgi:hypothetical protein
LKASKKTRKKNTRSKPCSNNSDDLDNEEEANCVRNLKSETNKYKDKLPFKFFNCGKFGHFSSKFSYERGSNSNEEEDPKKEKK